MDHKAIEMVMEDRDFPELLSSMDGEYKVFTLESDSVPVFDFRVGQNIIKQAVNLTDDGLIVIEIASKLIQDQNSKSMLKDFR